MKQLLLFSDYPTKTFIYQETNEGPRGGAEASNQEDPGKFEKIIASLPRDIVRILVLSVVLSQADPTNAREFKSTQGQTISGRVVSLDGEIVTIKTANGERDLPLDQFSEKDKWHILKEEWKVDIGRKFPEQELLGVVEIMSKNERSIKGVIISAKKECLIFMKENFSVVKIPYRAISFESNELIDAWRGVEPQSIEEAFRQFAVSVSPLERELEKQKKEIYSKLIEVAKLDPISNNFDTLPVIVEQKLGEKSHAYRGVREKEDQESIDSARAILKDLKVLMTGLIGLNGIEEVSPIKTQKILIKSMGEGIFREVEKEREEAGVWGQEMDELFLNQLRKRRKEVAQQVSTYLQSRGSLERFQKYVEDLIFNREVENYKVIGALFDRIEALKKSQDDEVRFLRLVNEFAVTSEGVEGSKPPETISVGRFVSLNYKDRVGEYLRGQRIKELVVTGGGRVTALKEDGSLFVADQWGPSNGKMEKTAGMKFDSIQASGRDEILFKSTNGGLSIYTTGQPIMHHNKIVQEKDIEGLCVVMKSILILKEGKILVCDDSHLRQDDLTVLNARPVSKVVNDGLSLLVFYKDRSIRAYRNTRAYADITEPLSTYEIETMKDFPSSEEIDSVESGRNGMVLRLKTGAISLVEFSETHTKLRVTNAPWEELLRLGAVKFEFTGTHIYGVTKNNKVVLTKDLKKVLIDSGITEKDMQDLLPGKFNLTTGKAHEGGMFAHLTTFY